MPRNAILCFVLCCPLLCHCAPQQDAAILAPSTEFRIRSLEAKFLELEQKQQALEVMARDRIQELQQSLAVAQDEVAQLRAVLREDTYTEPLAPPPPPPAKPSKTTKAPAKRASKPAPKAAPKPVPVKAAQSKPSAPVPPAKKSTDGMTLYKQALEHIQAGAPAKAIPLLQEFVAQNPSDNLTPDAWFWLGESYYFQGEYDQAILAYKNVAGRFPNNAKAPSAMLKIGYAYEKLQDFNNARFYLQALADEYPQSESAALAKQALGRLGN